MSKRQKQNKGSVPVIIAQIAPQSSAPSTVPFLSRPEVKELLQKTGLGSEEQRRLKEATDHGDARVEELYRCFQLAVDTILVSYYGEEPPLWADRHLGSIFDEITNYVPQGA